MNTNMFKKVGALLFLCIIAYASFYTQMPSDNFIDNPSKTEFSNARALYHVQNIAEHPHSVSSENHANTQEYIVEELFKMGLFPQVQEMNSYSEWGTLAKVQNIVARIKGSGNYDKALLLMTHYDSAGSSSYGASDAGSGVATILESIRSFLASGKSHDNDIIILFTDGEEIGMNGAKAFVQHHEWAKDVGLALNFEARGTGGPVYMIPETQYGNEKLVSEFIKANPSFPVANSLAYDVYKHMPNDTDLTVFADQLGVQGMNFAFIDDHYDYHTELDKPENLDNNSISHQASYLIPLLNHFANSSLTDLESTKDIVYLSTPFGVISYSYLYAQLLSVICFVAFVSIFIVAKFRGRIKTPSIVVGLLAFLTATIVSGLIGYFGWNIITSIYPHYNEMLHGFTYNGHLYILFFVLLTFAIHFYVYKKAYTEKNTKELIVVPLLAWILILSYAIYNLKGASFFMIPLVFLLISWALILFKKNVNFTLIVLLSVPALYIIPPFINQFPVALGLRLIGTSVVLCCYIFSLLLPILGTIRRKKILSKGLFLSAIIVFVIAHFNSDFDKDAPKPNSLVYFQNDITQKAYWMSYDKLLDKWNSPFFSKEVKVKTDKFNSKYFSEMKHVSLAPKAAIQPATIEKTIDTIIHGNRDMMFTVKPNRHVNSYIIQSTTKDAFKLFRVNQTTIKYKASSKFKDDTNSTIVQFYTDDNESMEIFVQLSPEANPNLSIIEISNDLISNPAFQVPARSSDMITKPFVNNDAVMIKQEVHFE